MCLPVIKDTGLGIHSKEVEKLFRVFSQTDSSTKRKSPGTGLGLALSKNLAILLGGSIVLTESAPQQGSTFTVTIDAGPIIKAGEMGPPDKTASAPAEVRLDGIKILVAEDSKDNQYLVNLLAKAGAEVELVDNGEAAIEKMHHERFDVVLMDLQMPVKDGYEAAAQLRDEGYKEPIIALTAYARSEEREFCLSHGFSDHIGKPINRNTLLNSIAALCQKH